MIKVTHVLYMGELPGQNPVSGAENQVILLLSELARRGHGVRFLVMMAGEAGPVLRQTFVDLRSAGVDVVLIPRQPGQGRWSERAALLRSWLQLWLALWRERKQIVHLHLELKYTPLLTLLAGCRQIVLTVHNDEPVYQGWIWRLRWRCWRLLGMHATGITKHVSTYIGRLAGGESWVSPIYYGLPCKAYPLLRRADFNLREHGCVVGFVGRLVPQKNLATLVVAAGRVTNLQVVIIGQGPERGSLELLARASGADVLFWGARREAAKYMQLFDALILPSRWEGLGLVLVEAMLQKVPVAGSRRGAIPEILGEGAFGVVFEPDEAAITDFLQSCRDAARGAPDIQAAFEYASRTFSVERMIGQFLDVYRTVQAAS